MKIAIVGVFAFLLALGGSTGFVVYRAKAAAPAVPDSMKVDTAKAGAHAPQGKPAAPATEPAKDSAAAAPADTAHAPAVPAPVAAPSHEGESAEPAAEPAPAVSAKPVSDVMEKENDFKPLARILGNMEPEQASSILGHLTDAQVEGVLRSVDARRAAAILAALPEERAAALGRRLLVPAPKDKVKP